MRFGVHYLPTYLPELDGSAGDYFRNVFQQVDAAEALGYDDVWITEHHFHEFGGIVPDPAAFLAALATRTSRIRLGIAIVVMPLHDPIEVAEKYAMVDVVSNGRLEFGVARGSSPAEFRRMKISYDESGLRLREGMEVVQRAWTDEAVTFHGKAFQYESIRVLPRTVQRPHPPVWVAASRSDDTYRWAGEKGFNLMILPSGYEPPQLRHAVGVYDDALRARGAASSEKLAKFLIYVAPSDAAARDEAAAFMDNYWAVADAGNPEGPGRSGCRTFDSQLAKGTVIAGDPARCVEMIHSWRELLGLTTVSGSFHFGGMPQELALKNLRLFAEKVMPAFSAGVRD